VALVAMTSPNSERNLYSLSWYRIAGLKPRLRSHIQIQRQSFRKKEWHLLHDHSSGRFHRISPEAWFIIGLMDGNRTMEDIWGAAAIHLGDSLPTQDEVIAILSQIHRFDGLQSDLPPDMTELSDRSGRDKRNRLISYLISPISFKIPLIDPDRFLERTIFLFKPVFTWFGALLWLAVVLYGLLLAGVHWDELAANVTDKVLSLENLLVLSLVFPVIKALHEFGHAFAVKRWGGEVHEMGIMLLVFIPIPYVDATSSYAFRDRRKRMLVGAAGIMVELFLAALSMVVWVNSEPGAVRSVAYNIMIIGGISTLLMNGNPLIRYDAYYILSDLLEIPNLATRSSEYLGYLIKHWILRISETKSTAATPGESFWLAFYGIVSFAYRVFIMTAIVLFVAGKFFVVGILIAGWTVLGFIVVPLQKMARNAASDPLMQRYRVRILFSGFVAAAFLTAAVMLVEMPSFTVVEGVVWVPTESRVNAGADGFVVKFLSVPDSVVRRGDPLILCEAPRLDKDVSVLRGALRETEARYQLSMVNDRAAAEIMKEELAKSRAELKRALERTEGLLIRSPSDGVFLLPLADDLPGKYVRKGEPLGYVVDFSHSIVRIVVSQDDVDLIRNRTKRIEARLASDLAATLQAAVIREAPAASREMPSMALSVSGGGTIALDPEQRNEPQAFKKNFIFDVGLTGARLSRVGERAFVRFEHFPETLARKWRRNIRQVLIKRFDF
jgi:putative peptide zinc metalloprotease protein